MKKSITLLSILGIVFYAAGLVLFFFLPALTNNLMNFDTAKLLDFATIQSSNSDIGRKPSLSERENHPT